MNASYSHPCSQKPNMLLFKNRHHHFCLQASETEPYPVPDLHVRLMCSCSRTVRENESLNFDCFFFFLAFLIKEIRAVAIELLTPFAGIGLVPVNTSWEKTMFSKSKWIRMHMHAQNLMKASPLKKYCCTTHWVNNLCDSPVMPSNTSFSFYFSLPFPGEKNYRQEKTQTCYLIMSVFKNAVYVSDWCRH